MVRLKNVIICLLIITIILGLGIYILNHRHSNDIITDPIEYIKEAELKYWECESKLVTEVQNYIDNVAPTSNLRGYNLVKASEKYEIDIKFMLAQGHIESHFGTKGLARRTNSVWNILAYDSLSYDQISKKGKYPHPNASIEPYCQLLKNNYLINKTEHDLMKSYRNISGHRYATDDQYEVRLTGQYNIIKNNTKIDSIQDQIRYYKIRAQR